ncbi:hypothetical protein SDC9_150624 [bioreactor metagenome]|uniref:Redox-active protein (C_GCAxxG_C_C) n=1 Tax=bioreactor metagenome TaxID=1076179 RepID=A0A645ESB2_9ZZZZ
MSKEKALAIFTAVPRTHNCAQAVAAGFAREALVDTLHDCGGGRAPEGLCGALHAALLMAPEDRREELRKRFAAGAGSVYCRTLKQELKFPCAECVRLGAALAEEFADKPEIR